MKPNWISIGSISAAIAVSCGAFGAHALKDRATPAELETWRTAVLYHLVHALALVAYGVFARSARTSAPGFLFTAGTALFSGSLYALALGAPRFVGALTPIGGIAWILGWLALARDARRSSAS